MGVRDPNYLRWVNNSRDEEELDHLTEQVNKRISSLAKNAKGRSDLRRIEATYTDCFTLKRDGYYEGKNSKGYNIGVPRCRGDTLICIGKVSLEDDGFAIWFSPNFDENTSVDGDTISLIKINVNQIKEDFGYSDGVKILQSVLDNLKNIKLFKESEVSKSLERIEFYKNNPLYGAWS